MDLLKAVSRRIDADDDTIRAALEDAHIPSLMNALVHLTADADIIRGDIQPESGFLVDPQGGIAEEDQARIREQAFEALKAYRDNGQRLPPAPDANLVHEMVNFASGQELSPEYGTFLEAELALQDEDSYGVPELAELSAEARANFKVVIVGAGMSGLLAGIRLKAAGIGFEIVERHGDVGGTWYQNTYPGCRVDSPNHTYSYSFHPTDWPQFYSSQEVLCRYFDDCATQYGLRENIRFHTDVEAAAYDEDRGVWRVDVRHRDGTAETLIANAIISAVGQLNRPKWPDIPGQDRYRGIAFHSTEWEHEHDLSGKRVVVIGTGASAFQFAPEVAKEAASVTIFQRTAPWIFNAPEYHEYVPDGKHWLLNHVPYYAKWFRFSMFWRMAEGILAAAKKDPAWNETDRAISAENDQLRELLTEGIAALCEEDEELRDKIIPDYPVAGKRILIDNGNWIRALRRDNVDLVTDPIAEIDETGVRTESGAHHDCDVLVYGTGFTASKFLWPMKITGRGGATLEGQWDGDARAYMGITVPNFPNLFCMYGPNTNIVVNGSIVFFSECEMRYILGCLKLLIGGDSNAMDCRQDVHDAYNVRIDEGNRNMAWGVSKAPTWYRNDKGRIAQNWPFTLREFWSQTREPDPADYVFS
ncbi:MAG: NAD(P)/FAD-dependent oxidoreductase [Gammaproteobacteria bacterium]|nr:NAD(P)/FAD-dependent oxidoreductase [Gammaproteobacteria bacterium]